jgi:hypothetical protein
MWGRLARLLCCRSCLRQDCPPLLVARWGRMTHSAAEGRCVQTDAASQMTKHALRACPPRHCAARRQQGAPPATPTSLLRPAGDRRRPACGMRDSVRGGSAFASDTQCSVLSAQCSVLSALGSGLWARLFAHDAQSTTGQGWSLRLGGRAAAVRGPSPEADTPSSGLRAGRSDTHVPSYLLGAQSKKPCAPSIELCAQGPARLRAEQNGRTAELSARAPEKKALRTSPVIA